MTLKVPIAGYPFSPKIVEKANCGPTVLATLLGIDTNEAMQVMDSRYKKGWNGYTNIGHIRAVLEHHGITMTKTKEYDGMTDLHIDTFPQAHVLLFLQMEGPWTESKYWRAAYTHTHWCLAYGARMMDVNNYRAPLNEGRPRWLWIEDWQDQIIPHVVASYDDGTGWHVKSAYYVEEG